ncbi:hypothetical protein Tco_0384070, partial [Tanacetum coccineum]
MLMIRRRCVSIRNAYAFIRSWVPDFVDKSEDEDQNDDDSKDGGSNVYEMGSRGGDSDVEEVPDTLFEKDGQVKNYMEEEVMDKPEDKSEDPFHIYS